MRTKKAADPGFKVCNTCGETKALEAFLVELRVRDGRTAKCRACTNAAHRIWQAANATEYNARQAERSRQKTLATRLASGDARWGPRYTEDGRRCSGCKRRKPVNEFSPDRSYPDGVSPYCKPCASRRHAAHTRTKLGQSTRRRLIRQRSLRENYGMTLADFEALVAEQDGKCAICQETFTDALRSKGVDHCHATEKIRGILCVKCNAGLGQFRDNEAYLMSAIEYLRRHRAND